MKNRSPITFVTFYIDVTAQTMDSIHQTTSTITVTEPQQYIQTMFASARHFHRDCRTVILSDQVTPFPPHPGIKVIRYQLDPQQPMLSRSIAWLDYLRSAAEGHTIFLDSDILINGDLGHVFADEFAVALTYRDESKWPVNAGLNFAHGGFLPEAARFHQIWLRHYQAAHQQYSVWGGDQDALRDLFSQVDFVREDSFNWQFGDIDIRFIPCARYNFSTSYTSEMDGYYPDASVLHFKGRRKPQMFPYWHKHIRPSATNEG